AAPPAAAPRAEAGPPPSAEAGAPDQAEAESRTWTGMEPPARSGPPQPPANLPGWNGTSPPVLPRRVRQPNLAPRHGGGPLAYSSLPGRFPGPRSSEETRSATASAIQDGAESGRSMPGQADGLPQESGAAEADGAGSGGPAGEGGAAGPGS
ncbi:MAG: hypothetical protein J2P30_22340, partial [Actinobacteria bacterium]|nr:hypothetical protein [Actinomycetota bacterium]